MEAHEDLLGRLVSAGQTKHHPHVSAAVNHSTCTQSDGAENDPAGHVTHAAAAEAHAMNKEEHAAAAEAHAVIEEELSVKPTQDQQINGT